MFGFDFALIALSVSGWAYLVAGRPGLALASFTIALIFGVWRRRDVRAFA